MARNRFVVERDAREWVVVDTATGSRRPVAWTSRQEVAEGIAARLNEKDKERPADRRGVSR